MSLYMTKARLDDLSNARAFFLCAQGLGKLCIHDICAFANPLSHVPFDQPSYRLVRAAVGSAPGYSLAHDAIGWSNRTSAACQAGSAVHNSVSPYVLVFGVA